jgi:hypothetical protein
MNNIYIYIHTQYIYIEPRLNLHCFCADPQTGQLGPTPNPIVIWAHDPHTPTCALVCPNRPIRPNLFIGHQAPPARVPCAATAVRHVAAAVPRAAAARVCRPPRAGAPPSSTPPPFDTSPLPFDRVLPLPLDSIANRRPHPLVADTELSRTSVITGPST